MGLVYAVVCVLFTEGVGCRVSRWMKYITARSEEMIHVGTHPELLGTGNLR